jgi:hypothetical protein
VEARRTAPKVRNKAAEASSTSSRNGNRSEFYPFPSVR